MYRALVGVGMLSALIIAWTFHMTEPVIRKNKTEALEKAIFAVIPDARSKVAFRLNEQGHFEEIKKYAETEERVYAAYDANKRLIGFAIKALGMGYQDVIELLYGYAPEQEAIIGMAILASRETPGLGSRIGTDSDFLRNFERLEVSLIANRQMIDHPIETVSKDQQVQQWQIDGIAGATVSSKAVGAILRRSTEMWIPKIAQNLEDFEIGNETHRN